jgi:hypothetical protein
MKTRYKFLNLRDGKIVSKSGDLTWEIGKWEHVDGKIVLCQNGLHSSKSPLDALNYVYGEVLAKVEIKGKIIEGDDKEVSSDMRIIEAYEWQQKDSVALSIFVAELVLKNYENLYPDDDRPRKAIEAAKAYLADPSERNMSAAWSAWSAARSAAWSAWSAESAESAESARSAARSAAWSAASAAASAALQINKWIIDHMKDMTPIN